LIAVAQPCEEKAKDKAAAPGTFIAVAQPREEKAKDKKSSFRSLLTIQAIRERRMSRRSALCWTNGRTSG
jgi:hypothetical protein